VARTNGSSTESVCHLSLVMARASALGAAALWALTAFTISASVLSCVSALISTSSLALISGGACPKPATAQMRTITADRVFLYLALITSPSVALACGIDARAPGFAPVAGRSLFDEVSIAPPEGNIKDGRARTKGQGRSVGVPAAALQLGW